MWISLLLGSAMTFLNLAIQVVAVAALVRMFNHRISAASVKPTTLAYTWVLSQVMLVLYCSLLLQSTTWAILFIYLGQFGEFATAFYFSLVNFTSLGYGDIVMNEQWRLLGALEAANGVMMFGLSAGMILSVLSRMLAFHAQQGAWKKDHEHTKTPRHPKTSA